MNAARCKGVQEARAMSLSPALAWGPIMRACQHRKVVFSAVGVLIPAHIAPVWTLLWLLKCLQDKVLQALSLCNAREPLVSLAGFAALPTITSPCTTWMRNLTTSYLSRLEDCTGLPDTSLMMLSYNKDVLPQTARNARGKRQQCQEGRGTGKLKERTENVRRCAHIRLPSTQRSRLG